MTNRDVYGEKMLDIMSVGERVAIDKEIKEPVKCGGFECQECLLFDAGCTSKSLARWLNEEYTEPQIDWSSVAVDTPILVKMLETDEWGKRYFAKYEDGHIFAFGDGATSWSSDGDVFPWRFGKIANMEEK